MTPDLPRLAAGLAAAGLRLRGAFHPTPEDGVPTPPGGHPARTVAMVGNVGAAEGDPMWRAFAAARHRFGGPNPLDDWTRSVVEPLARSSGAQALYPFAGPPHLPFQRWAMRAEPVAPSPIGILVHSEYGLWHGYRAALVFAERLVCPPRAVAAVPCDTCVGKPCLATCPVGAFSTHGYDVLGCADYLESAAGTDCMGRGCRARRACPVAPDRAPAPDQARFHMEAFRRGARRPRP